MDLQRFSPGAKYQDVIAAIEKDGGVILEKFIDELRLKKLQNDCDHELANTPNCDGVFFGYSTKRVATMVSKSDICQQMIVDDTVLAVMDHFLLPNCSDYQLNLSQLIAIGGGERQQIIHPDDPMFPFEHDPSYQVMINVMWAVDDFTIENGATHVAPGSHVWGRDRHPTDEEVIQAEMPAGSCLIYLGSTRHGGGANRTNKPRRGLVNSYSLGWLKQSENHFLSIPLSEVRGYPAQLQKLIGYFVHKPNLNMVDGRDPMEILEQGDAHSHQFKDYMPDHIEEALQEHYAGKDVAVAK